MEIQFLGATRTVTGSKYLVKARGREILVDCGLFQGLKELRERNWNRLPINPRDIDAVLLTHAHLDHSGYLPLLVRNGFHGQIHCTSATHALCGILLPDSGYLQEEEADFANRQGYSKHKPALPLYTRRDAQVSLDYFNTIALNHTIDLGDGITARYIPAGHILGAAMIELTVDGTTILFSGDLGRPNDPLLPAPAIVRRADYLFIESTYGNRRHPDTDPADELADVITRTASRGGVVLIPAFAVGRTQTLLYLLYRLKKENRIPDIPIHVDSPMASSAIDIFRAHPLGHLLSAEEAEAVCSVAKATESVEESKALDRMRVPRVIISASGMATGGRVLHHLKVFAPDPRNTILFCGYQAAGTRGASIVGGARSVRIHGQDVSIHAEVEMLDNLSAHADHAEILAWLRNFEQPPRTTFIVHGEPDAADAMKAHVEGLRGWKAHVPRYEEIVRL